MAKYRVKRPFFHNGERYAPDEEKRCAIELNDERLVYKYRVYIGAEIPPVKRKGHRVKKTVKATAKQVRNAVATK